jgi:hypothetical protein
VKEIWQRQFPLGPFEKWFNKGLKMLMQDLAQAGIDVEEYIEFETMASYKHNSEQQLMSRVGIPEGDGPVLWFSMSGRSPSSWALSWDPFVEELSGEFWATIENCEQTVPGSWVDEDDDDDGGSGKWRCLLESVVDSVFCYVRHTNNEELRVRGMMTCREMRQLSMDGIH